MRGLVSLADLAVEDVVHLSRRAAEFGRAPRVGGDSLRDRVVAIYFEHTSTRTRTAFSSGAVRLGADIISFGPGELQVNTGETVEDTARVLAGMVDGLVIRHSVPMARLRGWTRSARMGVINAMCAEEHPTQAVTDLATMVEIFGDLPGLRVLYLGEGNNTASALALACAMCGIDLFLRTPPGYGVDPAWLAQARGMAHTSVVDERHDLAGLPDEVDVVYTTRWQTTGTSKPDPRWREGFEPFRVDEELLARYPRAWFMHDLPAHRGEEVSPGVLDGPRSVAFRQAEFKLFGAMAVLEWSLG